MTLKSLLAAAAAAALLAAPAMAETILEKVAADPELSVLSGLLADAGVAETLQGAGPFTLFAPNDAAFAALPQALKDELAAPAGRQKLKDVLLDHIANGEYDTGRLKGSEVAIEMADGNEVIGIAKDGVTVGGGAIVEADLRASNGVIHVIDKVLLAHE